MRKQNKRVHKSKILSRAMMSFLRTLNIKKVFKKFSGVSSFLLFRFTIFFKYEHRGELMLFPIYETESSFPNDDNR